MTDLALTLDTVTGIVLVEAPDRLPAMVRYRLVDLLGEGVSFGCARPLAVLPPPEGDPEERTSTPSVRISGYYHNSLVEGPGRRTSALLSGCDLACPGCWVPDLHPVKAGTLVSVDRLAEALMDPAYERDGVSFLGGEPMQQPEGLAALARALRRRGCPHLVCYSGYTYEALLRRAVRQPAIIAALNECDILIDGPFVAMRADRAGPWTGSSNQRVIDLVATRRSGQVTLVEELALPLR